MSVAAHELKGFYIPINEWGRDHWSMLAYFESIEVDHGQFKILFDPRMRQNRSVRTHVHRLFREFR
jgi:hypothetical protein